MAAWQKRVRAGIAIVGIAIAILVYGALGTRRGVPPSARPQRLDPKAVLESVGTQVQRGRGVERDFDVKSDQQFVYEDGSTKLVGVEITVHRRAGRDFILTGKEASAGADQGDLLLAGSVTLSASDGFVLHADRATFSRTEALVQAPGPVSFEKGESFTGTGTGMSYQESTDVLTIAARARIAVSGQDTATPTEFSANTATLYRTEDMLVLDGDVRVVRMGQVLGGDRVVARLSPNEEVVRFIELRGNASVVGRSGSLESMGARDIDLDYTDDGQTLERVTLVGEAAISMPGRLAGNPARQLRGERLDITLALDGAITAMAGREGVQLDLPAVDTTPARTVAARSLDGLGRPNTGLTSIQFSGDVEYSEAGGRGSSARRARSQELNIGFDGDLVDSADFSGGTRFEEADFEASAADATYAPGRGTLRLTGHAAGVPPRVADARITVEGNAIDVTLSGRFMNARGTVKTTLRPLQSLVPGSTGAGPPPLDNPSRLPGLLQEEQPANLSADALEYEGTSGKGVYRGNAALWQGDTAIRADQITIDQQTGNLEATGNARSVIALERGLSAGRADEIYYDEARRTVIYRGEPLGRGAPSAQSDAPGIGKGSSPAPLVYSAMQAQLSGPQGDLRANRIELILADGKGRAERLEAYTGVTVRLGERIASGRRLTYFAADERYVVLGSTSAPVTVADRCRETSGGTLTFFGSTDRIVVDGNQDVRTRTKSDGPCTVSSAP